MRSRLGVEPEQAGGRHAAPTVPHTAVGCQPRSYSAGWLARASAAVASKPAA